MTDRRHQAADEFCKLRLDGGRGSEAQAPLRLGLDRLDHPRVRVPEDERSPGAHVVDVALAIRRPDVWPGSAGQKQRIAADAQESADRRIHAAGDVPAGFLIQFTRIRHSPLPPACLNKVYR